VGQIEKIIVIVDVIMIVEHEVAIDETDIEDAVEHHIVLDLVQMKDLHTNNPKLEIDEVPDHIQRIDRHNMIKNIKNQYLENEVNQDLARLKNVIIQNVQLVEIILHHLNNRQNLEGMRVERVKRKMVEAKVLRMTNC
jgi:hypothetical protein